MRYLIKCMRHTQEMSATVIQCKYNVYIIQNNDTIYKSSSIN